MEATTEATMVTKIHRSTVKHPCTPIKATITILATPVPQVTFQPPPFRSPIRKLLTIQHRRNQFTTRTITIPILGMITIPGISATFLWGTTKATRLFREPVIDVKRFPLRLYMRRLIRMLRSTRATLPSRRRGTDLIYPIQAP
jgi:hypothetical protein